MPTPEQIQQAINEVHDQESFIQRLLIQTLDWPIPEIVTDVEDMAVEWTDDELNTDGLSQTALTGPVLQLQPITPDQPWGIFILEFANEDVFTTNRGLTGPLRKVLRGLTPKRRGRPAYLPAWDRDHLLFICTHQYRHFRFAYFKSPKEKGHAEPLTTFGWGPNTPARTACEFNLPELAWPDDLTPDSWLAAWTNAFNIEKVTKQFYDHYKTVFEGLQNQIEGLTEAEDKKIFAQTLLNRLMFLRFVERKGWLKFGEDDQAPLDYLRKLFHAGPIGDASWYNSRLKPLFFQGLAIPDHDLQDIVGQVPYLNGGLFETTPLDDRVTDIPDDAFIPLFSETGLFYRYNFTVEESTPLDVDVAVDPEMLGKVFEKMINTRRESGSYYTPRTVVSFMCRESLRGYLGSNWTPLIDEHKNDDISVPQARDLLAKLAELKVVDPACGSGAYLLGMLQELYTITQLLDSRAEEATPHDAYQRKLHIIQHNIYGVDIDEFAVNIARLRLWLSLVVDFEGDEPDPLPNLDFKIETGDSLTAPDPSGGIEPGLHRELMKRYVTLRAQYLNPPPDADKNLLLRIITELKEDIVGWLHASGSVEGFDWQVEFLEVFVDGGFDIVIANPPYGTKGKAKVTDRVRNLYFNPRSDSERGQSKDPYGIFIARGLQLLREHGTLSYIVSDTWRTIKSHRPLRKRLLDNTTVFHVLDLPPWIFDAMVNTGVVTLKKTPPEPDHKLIAGDLHAIPNGDWKMLSDNLIAVSGHGLDIQTLRCARYTYPQSLIATYSNLSFFIASPQLYRLMSDPCFTKLVDVADVKVGLQTGNNNYYVRKSEGARGIYEILQEELLLNDDEVAHLTQDEKENGVNPKDHGGHYFLPYDKGGASDSDEGWLPNYYVPTDYFIDWSAEAVDRLKLAAQLPSGTLGKAFIRNPQFYFVQGITWSDAGFYSPTIRLSGIGVFDVKGSRMIIKETNNLSVLSLLGILCSRLLRCLIKAISNHTVSTQVDDFREMPMPTPDDRILCEIEALVSQVIGHQKADQQYPYHLNEQKEIDALTYSLYGLADEDVREVELWYCRRYARLAEAQGVLAEVQEKYTDHLARCEMILSKQPSYWRSNPVLKLIAQGESHTLEFKETLQYNTHTNQADNNLLHSSLKTIAAFVNADGGTLLIGVSDAGDIKGLARDLQVLGRNANNDRFELKIRNAISGQNSRFTPHATGYVDISFAELAEGTICRVDVKPLARTEVLHFDNRVYVRDGNQTLQLEGPALTTWIQQRNA